MSDKRVRQGVVLMTDITRRWSKSELEDNQARESLMVFSHFDTVGEGRDRTLIAMCNDSESAARIVRTWNAHDDLVSLLSEMVEPGADLTDYNCHRGITTAEKCGRCGPILKGRNFLDKLKT